MLVHVSCSDGHRQDVASCVRELRNKKHPTHMKVVFYGNTLEVRYIYTSTYTCTCTVC